MNPPATSVDLRRWERLSLAVGVVAAVGCVIGAIFNLPQFFRAYLWALLFWISLPLGALVLLMLYHLTGGAWGLAIRNLLESATGTVWLATAFIIPVLAGATVIYPWAWGLGGEKAGYLNPPFFIIRTVFYFIVWAALAYLMRRWSADHAEDVEAAPSRRLQLASGYGVIVYVLTATFASIDWVMSLDPNWYSTIYGMLFVTGQTLGALSATIVFLFATGHTTELERIPSRKPLLDLGNLLLAFILLWSYLAFMQFLIIWAGNLKEEIPRYWRRSHDIWPWVAVILFVFHFLVPFVVLLTRGSKKRVRILATIAGCVLVMRLVDWFWHLGPPPRPGEMPIHWLFLFTLVAVGGFWGALFLKQLQRRIVAISKEVR